MRILHVFYFSDMGGIESYAIDLFGALAARGHDNVLLYDGAEPSGPAPGLRSRLRVHGLIDHGKAVGERLSRAVYGFLEKAGCDLVFLNTTMNRVLAEKLIERLPTVYFAHTYDAFCAAGALLHGRTGEVCTLRGVPDGRCLVNAYLKGCNTRHPARLLARYRRTAETSVWTRRADALLCGSEYVHRRHVENGWPGERVHVVPCPVRQLPGTLPPRPLAPSAGRPPIVLFAGRVTPQKGLEYLLRAALKVDRPHRLVVAGDGYGLSAMRVLARRLGLADRVEFAGRLHREALDDLYAQASVVVVPSVWPEPFGLVGPEAMAHGVPVVAFRVGGIPEWLMDQETGILVEPRDVAGLAGAIRRLLDDRALARRLGESARLVARHRYTYERHAESIERVFLSVLAARRPVSRAMAVTA